MDMTVYPQSLTDVPGSKLVNSSLMSNPYFKMPLGLSLDGLAAAPSLPSVTTAIGTKKARAADPAKMARPWPRRPRLGPPALRRVRACRGARWFRGVS